MSNIVKFPGRPEGENTDLRLETYVASKFGLLLGDGEEEFDEFERWANSHGYRGLFFCELKTQIDWVVTKMEELLATHKQSGIVGTWPIAFEYYEEGWPWPVIKICTRWRSSGSDADDPLAISVVFTIYTLNGQCATPEGIPKGATAGELKVMAVHPKRFVSTDALEALLAPVRQLTGEGFTPHHQLGFSEARFFSDYRQYWSKVIVPETIAEINFVHDVAVTIPAEAAIMDVEQ